MTRVLDYGNESNYSKSGSAWPVYRRLLGYAMRFKGQLALVLLFSVIVAASFTSILVGAGSALGLLLDDQETVEAQLEGIAGKIRGVSTDGEGNAYAPFLENADQRFVNWAFDLRREENALWAMIWLCGTLVGLSLIGGLARYFQEYFAGSIGASISVNINQEMFDNMLRLSHPFFESHNSAEVQARFTNDAFMVNKGLANVLVKVVREPIKAVFFLALALGINTLLTIVVLLVMPPVIYVIQRVGKRVKKSARKSLQGVAAMGHVIKETVTGISIVKSFRMEEYEQRRIRHELGRLRKNLIRMARADAIVGPTTEFLMVLGVVAFIIISQQQVSSGALTYGQLSTLFLALAAMLDPLRKLTTVNNMVQTSVASAERVFEFIDIEPTVREREDPYELPPLSESLAFEDVRFSYDGAHDVLNSVSFRVPKGQMVALVGFSGAGKSTVAKLIPRFYDATGGRIAIDGMDIRDCTLSSLRDQIGYVTQDTILFNETVRGNIAFGQTHFSAERVREAAEAAHADEFITRLSQGYETMLGEAGANLSGGQRQRIAIARAIIKDPAILILDEATSSLDSESEQAIQQAIAEFIVGRTTVVIAHRLSTIRRADRIVVIHEGRVHEEGTHDELLVASGLYQRLYEQQFAPAKEPSAP